jgi:hypothetical protein
MRQPAPLANRTRPPYHELVEHRLEIALGLLKDCDRLYIGAGENDRQGLNQAFFEALFVDKDGVKRAVLNPPFAELTDRSIGLDKDDEDGPEPSDDPGPGPRIAGRTRPHGPSRRVGTRGRPVRKNPETSRSQGSNLTLMAERAGFEPATHLSARTRFPVALLRPLGHLSATAPA